MQNKAHFWSSAMKWIGICVILAFSVSLYSGPNETDKEPYSGLLTEHQIDSLKGLHKEFYNSRKYPELLQVYHQLYKHYERIGNTKSLIEIELSLADINRASKNFDHALRILNQILENVPWNEHEIRSRAYSLRAATYYELKQSDIAIRDAKTSINLALKLDNAALAAPSYNILGAAYRKINLDSSIIFLKRSAEVHLQIQDSLNLALVYFNMANTYGNLLKEDSAMKYAHLALDLATEYNIPNYQVIILNLLVTNKIKNNQLRDAIHLIKLRDSIHNEVAMDLMAMQVNQVMELMEEEREAENLKIIQENLELNRKINDRKDLFLLLATLILGLFSAILIVIYRNNLRDKKYLKELRDLNEEVSEASEQLIDLNKTKDKILSVISHDMRSPFSQFITYLSFAEEGDISDEDRKMINTELLATSRNGLHMLDNLLYWAGTQQDGRKIMPVNFSISEILKDVKDYLNFLSHRKEIRVKIKCDLQLTLLADRMLYEIVVRNLVSNAIKFAPEKSEVVIEVKEEGDRISTYISDHGPGIPDDIKSAFAKKRLDYKSSLGSRGEKGAGMGLYISAEFARQNGGDIQFEDVKEGTLVRFSLPKEQ